MRNYIIKRFLQLIPVVILVAFFSFFVINAAPGSAIDNYIKPDMTPEQIQALKVQYGVDGTWVEQFIGWLKRTLQGDFGVSIYKKRDVTELIGCYCFVGRYILVAFIDICYTSRSFGRKKKEYIC